MPEYRIDQYLPARLTYDWDERSACAHHNFSTDVQGFALWEASRHRESELIELLSQTFEVLRTYEVHWSQRHVASNFNRLYGRSAAAPASRSERVGGGPFLYVVVKDPRPRYIFWKNVSGRVELTNNSVAHLKPRLRKLVESDFMYNVHSSNSLAEFVHDATLILGPNESSRLLKDVSNGMATSPDRTAWHEDMIGAGGWTDIEELFRTVSMTQRFCVLRSVEEAMRPIVSSEGDIDILCEDARAFAAEINADQSSFSKPNSHFYVDVAGSRIHFDLREVGDGDIDKAWQRSILANVDTGNFPFLIPSSPDCFFYLAYHTVLHKARIKESHQSSLREGAEHLGLAGACPDIAVEPTDDLRAIVRGFLAGSGYRVTQPQWPGVSLHSEQLSGR